jgi:hypothetical protein
MVEGLSTESGEAILEGTKASSTHSEGGACSTPCVMHGGKQAALKSRSGLNSVLLMWLLTE